MDHRRGAGLLAAGIALALGAGGCVDIRSFSGTWAGPVTSEPAVRVGFAAGVRVDPLELTRVQLRHVEATLTTSDGRFKGTRLLPVAAATGDALGNLTFDGGPLRAYLLQARPLGEQPSRGPALVVLSLYEDDRVELRVLRGDDLYGVFHLHRVK